MVEYWKNHLNELINSATPSKIGWPQFCLFIFLPEYHADAVSIVFQTAYLFLTALKGRVDVLRLLAMLISYLSLSQCLPLL